MSKRYHLVTTVRLAKNKEPFFTKQLKAYDLTLEDEYASMLKVQKRTVGVFDKLTDIFKYIIIKNYGNLCEAGYWPWLVIESVEEGLYPCNHNKIWFEFDKEKEKWLLIKDPQEIVDAYKNNSVLYDIADIG